MASETNVTDRYISFDGIQCDLNADRLISMLENNIKDNRGAPQWHNYFNQKRAQQEKGGHDNLHFIGNQINTLYEYFKQCEDTEAVELLYKIEQECC